MFACRTVMRTVDITGSEYVLGQTRHWNAIVLEMPELRVPPAIAANKTSFAMVKPALLFH